MNSESNYENQGHTSISRRQFLRRVTYASGGLVLMSGLRQASGTALAATPGKTGGTVTVAVMGDFASFDPFNMSWVNYPMTQVLYNQFMRYDHEMKLFPELAESWKTSQDGRRSLSSSNRA